MWKDKYGNQIKVTDMSDEYLRNAITYVKRKAKEGLLVQYGGSGANTDDMWYDEEILYGKEVFERFEGYKDLVKESKRRKNTKS